MKGLSNHRKIAGFDQQSPRTLLAKRHG